MNELQQKWVEALESGHYRQGQEFLVWGDRYCCLGVACEVMIRNGVQNLKKSKDDRSYIYKGVVLLSDLGFEIYKVLGLHDRVGYFNANTLTALNDSGCSFAEIAKIIRENETDIFVQEKPNECDAAEMG